MSRSSQPSYPDLRGKVAIVTGIGQIGVTTPTENWGNGAAITLTLARNGVEIFGCDINLEAGRHTKQRVEADVPDAVIDVISTDVTSSSAVETLVQECIRKHGRVDILVNNVGRNEPGGPVEITEQVWDAQVDINLKSVYLTCHSVLPIMEAQGSGAIINISSISGLRYLAKPEVAYSATKAAVTQFTKHTAVLYAAKGVRLNVVSPGLVYTPLVHAMADKFANGDVESFVATRHAQVPTGKMGLGTDVANAVAFLSSDVAARYVIGQNLVVDGGITASTGRA